MNNNATRIITNVITIIPNCIGDGFIGRPKSRGDINVTAVTNDIKPMKAKMTICNR